MIVVNLTGFPIYDVDGGRLQGIGAGVGLDSQPRVIPVLPIDGHPPPVERPVLLGAGFLLAKTDQVILDGGEVHLDGVPSTRHLYYLSKRRALSSQAADERVGDLVASIAPGKVRVGRLDDSDPLNFVQAHRERTLYIGGVYGIAPARELGKLTFGHLAP